MTILKIKSLTLLVLLALTFSLNAISDDEFSDTGSEEITTLESDSSEVESSTPAVESDDSDFDEE
jgi:hypothetical protein